MCECRKRLVRILFSLAFSPSCLALDPTQPASSYLRTNFTMEDGLPSNIVNQVLQTRDGFLWLCTPSQLARFDGRHFVPIPLPRGISRMATPRALVEAADGDLWVGTDIGLTRISRGLLDQFGRAGTELYHPGPGLSDLIVCLQFDVDGNLWVGTRKGLFRFDHGVFTSVIPDLFIARIEKASKGRLLIVTSNGFVEWDGTQLMKHPELAVLLGVPADKIYHVFEDHAGALWYCTGAGLARQAGSIIQRFPNYNKASSTAAFRAFEDQRGNIWVTMAAGLFRVVGDRLEPVCLDIDLKFAMSDQEGDLWLGTNGSGLIRYKDRLVRMFTSADGLPNDITLAVLATSDGKLWVGNNCGGISWFDGRRFHTYSERDGLTNSCVYALAEDADHDLWVGTYGGGLFRLHNGRFTQFSRPEGLLNDFVRAILPVRDGSLWFVTPNEVGHLSGGHIRNYAASDGVTSPISIYQDRQGRIWLGLKTGIVRLEGDRFIPASEGTDRNYRPIWEDASGRLYAGSEAGIFRVGKDHDGVIEVTKEPKVVHTAFRSGRDLWLIGDEIFRASTDSLERWEHEPGAHRDYTVFDRSDGLTSAECSDDFPNFAYTPDGKLWVATLQGLAMFEPSGLPRDDRKPAIYMEQITVGQDVETPGRELILAPGTSHAELQFSAIELRSPEKIHFQYRMDGVDKDWLDGNAAGTAVYNSFPRGTHQFHVRACNRDGIWDRAGFVYNITQQPYFYETRLFQGAEIGALLLLLGGAYQVRLRQMAARMNAQLDARVDERTRLARELHDTLLQTIQVSRMVAEHTLDGFRDNPSDPRTGALEKISRWLDQAVQEARKSLESLRSSATQTNDLLEALREDRTQALPLESSVTGPEREMHPIVRDEVYRIAYEAIRNACMHSGGTRVRVEINYEHDLVLRVRDDGKGIDAELLDKGKPGHFGLSGMRERAARIGGRLSFVPSPSGTTVELTVPSRLAFRASRKRWHTLFRRRERGHPAK